MECVILITRFFVWCVQLLPTAAMLGSGHSAGLASGHLATSAAGGTASDVAGAVLPVESLGAGGTAYILAQNVYADPELAVLVNRLLVKLSITRYENAKHSPIFIQYTVF